MCQYFQGVLSTAIPWKVLVQQYQDTEAFSQEILRLIESPEPVSYFFTLAKKETILCMWDFVKMFKARVKLNDRSLSLTSMCCVTFQILPFTEIIVYCSYCLQNKLFQKS